MFRLSNKGSKPSEKNHRIINQTTKISDAEKSFSKTQFHQEELSSDSGISESSNLPREKSMEDFELYINKMNEYVQHMKILENRNATLEAENCQFKEENDVLRQNMEKIQESKRNDLLIKPGYITGELSKHFL